MDCGEGDKRDVRRPMNAFLIFCKRHRSIVREKNPDLDNRSVTRILGDLWANLKDDEKSMYTDLAKQYKDAFMKANPDYKWHNPEKAVTPQKPNMPKPTNMKVLKNDLDLFTEGSIIPGKLADPSNMGGLSLLLIAGQQSDNQNLSSDSLNTVRTEDTSSEAKTENCDVQLTNMSQKPPVEPPDKVSNTETTGKVKIVEHMNGPLLSESTNITDKQIIDKKNDTASTEGEKKIPSLLDLAEMCVNHLDGKKTTQQDNIPKHQHSLLKEAILDIKPDKDTENNTHGLYGTEMSHAYVKPKSDEKENISELIVYDLDDKKEIEEEEEESALITCGKLVVNHIIDKLYSSEIATAARKVSKPLKGPLENAPTSITKKNNDPDPDKLDNIQPTEQSKVVNVIKTDSKVMEFDEPDGLKDQETPSSGKVTEHINITPDHSSLVEQFDNGNVSTENSQVDLSTELSVGKRKHLLSETGSTEGEDMEESQPIRKSRRRNRGQRYQELINEGIIQPSKERMAALQQPTQKDEMLEEDFQSIDSYILPETAIRRIRKRTTSESAKDKLYPPDDSKRYKTGDFDLEAHIATLPACPIESMGRKRGFVRSRHCSETSHIRKQTADESQVVPVFDTEKTVSLPPHVRLPSPQRNQEPVIGSRKRKARKHSITHLIPVPPTLRINGKSSQNISGTDEATHTSINTDRSEENKQPNMDENAHTVEQSDLKSGSNDINDNDNCIGHERTITKLETFESCDKEVTAPKIEAGCDKEQENLDESSIVKNGGECVGAINGYEKLDQDLNEHTANDTDVSSKAECQGQCQGQDLQSSGKFGADDHKVHIEDEKVLSETSVSNTETCLNNDDGTSGKLSESNCKSLQEVNSNIPRGGSDVISHNEAGVTADGRVVLDSLDKKGPNIDKPGTDLNFNSTVHS